VPSGEQGHPGSFPVQATEDASGVKVFDIPSCDDGLSPLLVHPEAHAASPNTANMNKPFAQREANGHLAPP
jgi:hypothetical protein